MLSPVPLSKTHAFITESNLIEGIDTPDINSKDPWLAEQLSALDMLLMRDHLTVTDVVEYVGIIQPGAVLRDRVGLDVQVGHFKPPAGGEWIRIELLELLELVNADKLSPLRVHQAYEILHPFTDGNGRSGRAIWAHHMVRHHGYRLELGFLHQYYYQSLKHAGDCCNAN